MCSVEQTCHQPLDPCTSGYDMWQKMCDPPMFNSCVDPYPAERCTTAPSWKPVCSPTSDCCSTPGYCVCQKMCESPVDNTSINPYSDERCRKVRCHKPVCNPRTPFEWKFYHGIDRMIIYMCAAPTKYFDRISIRFNCGTGLFTDVAFLFEIRSCGREVVRTTRRTRAWENEENDIRCFPFQACAPFDMIIRIEHDKYRVAVNGQHFIDYCHRMKNFFDIKSLLIEGDICISKFQACGY